MKNIFSKNHIFCSKIKTIYFYFLLTMVDYSTLNYLDGSNVPGVFDTQIGFIGDEYC